MKECNCHRGPEVGKKVVGCPPKVININHPQEPVLFHRVDVPAVMGDDVTYPPENGLYKNVLLVYEANNHTYLYNSDGIPTNLSLDISELEERMDDAEGAIIILQDDVENLGLDLVAESGAREEADTALGREIEDLKNSPDVVDIVDTYADLEDYDTSGLGDKDTIRVLNDETQDGKSAYYRWDKPNSQWVFIGAIGNYYTKEETDERIESVYGKSKVLTSDDYNWNSVSKDTTEPFDSVALWLLDDGIYSVDDDTVAYVYKTLRADTASYLVAESISGPSYKAIYAFEMHFAYVSKNYGAALSRFTVTVSNGSLLNSETFTSRTMTEALISDFIKSGNGAPSGTPIEGAGLLYEDKTNGKLYRFDGANWVEMPTVVQDTGASTTDVMSQKAVRDLIFNAPFAPDGKNNIQIGHQAKAYNNSVAIGNQANYGRTNDSVVAIGNKAYGPTSGEKSIVIGYEADCHDSHSICIGSNTYTTHKGCIMLGSYSNGAVADGTMYIGTSDTTYGYNASNFRLLSGLYDPQTDHDAATKGYVDNKLATKIISSGASAPSTSTVGEVGTLCTYVTSGTGHLAICTEVNAGTPTTYTWQTLI